MKLNQNILTGPPCSENTSAGEEVHHCDRFAMARQPREPLLCAIGIPRRTTRPSRNENFGEVKTEHKKFAVDSNNSPDWIPGYHLKD
jgi:hypothetical protein